MQQTVVLATGNQGKVTELARMLTPLEITVVPQSDYQVEEVPETGTTFVENAIIKARHAAKITGLPAIADDSGLAVDFLEGAPGIYSARYSGDQATDASNVNRLLREMADIPESQRTARFICVLVFMRHADDPTPIICQGEWQGRITTRASGDAGFGYDPVFWVDQHQCTSAELSSEQKNAISHRGLALQQLLTQLRDQQD